MIQIFAHLPDGRFATGARDALEESFELAWVDMVAPTTEELSWLAGRFHFHPLAIEDCINRNQIPKIEEYTDHLFLVLHGLLSTDDATLSFPELHIFFTPNVVVTVHDDTLPSLVAFREKVARDRSTLPLQSDFLLHRVIDTFVDGWPQALLTFERRVEKLDSELLATEGIRRISEIHTLQMRLNEARHMVGPQTEILQELYGGNLPWISEKAAVYLRDVEDHVIRLQRTIEEYRESLYSIRDATISVAAHQSNETMKRLTVFSVIFLPLTFITGFFGMNFTQIPWSHDRFFWIALVVIAALPFVMIAWLRHRKWI